MAAYDAGSEVEEFNVLTLSSSHKHEDREIRNLSQQGDGLHKHDRLSYTNSLASARNSISKTGHKLI